MGSHVETYLPKLPKPKVKLLRVPTGGLEVKLAEEKKNMGNHHKVGPLSPIVRNGVVWTPASRVATQITYL